MSNNSSNKIVLCGGGTAGHVMPNIALLPELNKHFSEINYIGSSNGIEKDIIKKYPIKYHEITTVKLVRSLTPKNLLIPFKLIKGIKESKKLLKEINPSIVFSKGGFVSVPVTIAAKKLNIPVVAHESDLSLGLANKIILKQCKVMCCSFKETALALNNKGICTLSPVRQELFSGNSDLAKKECGFYNNLPTLLVIGGSLGAKKINETMFECAKELTKKFNIIHIVGAKNFNKNIKQKNYHQIEFTVDIQNYFSLCDIVVSRAGSNAIFEFLALKKPMLLIPLPKGNSRGDQIENANNFLNNGFAHILYQENLTKESLINAINKLYSSKQEIIKNQQKYSGNGVKNIVEQILKYSK